MSNKLKFNIGDLEAQANALDNIQSDLSEASKDLTGKLAELKKDWDSEAGRAFFNKYDDSWTKEVENTCTKVHEMAEALRVAGRTYQPIEDEFNTINL